MAHFSSTNYDQYHDNYQYNYHHPYNYDNPHELRYANYDHNYNDNLAYSYNNYNDNYDYNHNYNYNYNAYEVAPSKSVVGYYYNYSNYNPDFSSSKNANLDENGEYFYDPVSTQFIISYNNNNNSNNINNNVINNKNDDDDEDDNASKFKKVKSDLDYEEYDPTPYDGGYDIVQTYGKPLPPSHDICYPPTKPDTSPIQDEINLIDSKDDGQKGVIVPVIEPELNSTQQEENVVHSDEDEDEDEDDDENDQYIENGTIVEQVGPNSNTKHEENVVDSEEDEDEDEDEAEDNNNKAEIRRQIPPGCGIEAMDICDGLFGYGGYFPCLSKKIKGVVSTNCNECGGEVKVNKVVVDEYECWRGTVDYLFGNPNPYGGAMPEKGSYGDPVYSYHRHFPQKSIVGVNYGYDGDYEYR